MDIAQAKQELRRTIRAYTAKTEDGVYRMPRRMQRPVLLMGPPGIGKTAILSQLAQEEHIGLAAYTMTHHTRQSALGLPVIVGRTAAGKTFRATEYTMSEIIASVYEQMEKTGLREGILFLDEINCVSETLMPAILQMLQNKTFGVHSLPEGWLIVAAGNPPRYNQSARSFDMATLDRVRCIELEPSLAAWQPYAAASGVHPAVLSYLRLHPEHFFLCSASAAAGEFATARGWEELSALLLAYEALGYPCTLAQMQQYLHAQEAAAGFAAFYDLFRRYAAQLPLEEILTGTACPEAGALRELPFDGRLSVVEFLLHSLQTKSAAMQQDADLAFSASSFAGSVPPGADALARAQELLQKRRAALAVRKDCGVLPPEEERREAAFLSRAEAALAPARTDAEASAALQKLAADAAASAQIHFYLPYSYSGGLPAKMTIHASQPHPRIISYKKDGSLSITRLSLQSLNLLLPQTTLSSFVPDNAPANRQCVHGTLHRPYQKGKDVPSVRSATSYPNRKKETDQSFRRIRN